MLKCVVMKAFFFWSVRACNLDLRLHKTLKCTHFSHMKYVCSTLNKQCGLWSSWQTQRFSVFHLSCPQTILAAPAVETNKWEGQQEHAWKPHPQWLFPILCLRTQCKLAVFLPGACQVRATACYVGVFLYLLWKQQRVLLIFENCLHYLTCSTQKGVLHEKYILDPNCVHQHFSLYLLSCI